MLPMANPIDNSGQNHGLSPYEHQHRQEEEQDVYGLLSMEAQAAQNTALARNTMITIRFQVRRLRLTSTARRHPSRWSHSDPTFPNTCPVVLGLDAAGLHLQQSHSPVGSLYPPTPMPGLFLNSWPRDAP